MITDRSTAAGKPNELFYDTGDVNNNYWWPASASPNLVTWGNSFNGKTCIKLTGDTAEAVVWRNTRWNGSRTGVYPNEYFVRLVLDVNSSNDLSIPDNQFTFTCSNPNSYALQFLVAENSIRVWNGTSWVIVDSSHFSNVWTVITFHVKGLTADLYLNESQTPASSGITLYTESSPNVMVLKQGFYSTPRITHIDSLLITRTRFDSL